MGRNLMVGRARLTPEEAAQVDAVAQEPDAGANERAFQLLLQILRDKGVLPTPQGES
jgi:hypothetical protein